MGKYLDLWKDLKLIRKSSESVLFNYRSADRLDPFYAFSSYSTNVPSEKSTIRLIEKDAIISFKRMKEIKELYMINYASYVIPEEAFADKLFNYVEKKDKSIKDLMIHFSNINYDVLIRSVIWLHKFNLINIKI